MPRLFVAAVPGPACQVVAVQSGCREFPNMISSQEGTDARLDRPPAALRTSLGAAGTSSAGSCVSCSVSRAGGGAAGVAAAGVAAGPREDPGGWAAGAAGRAAFAAAVDGGGGWVPSAALRAGRQS
jgi:hypothetical protein